VGCSLEVGSLDADLEDLVRCALDGIGVAGCVLPLPGDLIRTLNFLNVASIGLFLSHVAEIEGLPSAAEGVTDSKFRQMPWWQDSVWLPLVENVAEVVEGTVFVGSCSHLLRELDTIAELSSAPLTDPIHEEAASPDSALTEHETLRFIWQRLHEGAETALASGACLSVV
jgi:hypothetical protein